MENERTPYKDPLRLLAAMLASEVGRPVEDVEDALRAVLGKTLPGGLEGVHAKDFLITLGNIIHAAGPAAAAYILAA